jgi:hypothetical protein
LAAEHFAVFCSQVGSDILSDSEYAPRFVARPPGPHRAGVSEIIGRFAEILGGFSNHRQLLAESAVGTIVISARRPIEESR